MPKGRKTGSSKSIEISGDMIGGQAIIGDKNTIVVVNPPGENAAAEKQAETLRQKVLNGKISRYVRNLLQHPAFSPWTDDHYFSLRVKPNTLTSNIDLLLITRETGDVPRSEFQNTYTAREAVMKFQQLVIIGPPGSGKTTTLRNLALAFARDYSVSSDADCYLPVLVRLPNYNSVEGATPYDRFLSLLRDAFNESQVDVTVEEVREILQRQPIILLLDGLNEIGHRDETGKFIVGVNRFVDTFPQHRVVITSRAHNVDLGNQRLPVLELVELQYPDHVRQYLLRYFDRPLNVKKIMDILESNSRLRQLAVNPLLLFLIIVIFKNQQGVLPSNRSVLLEKIAYGLLGNWDTGSSRSDKFWVEDKHRLLRSLGWAMKSEGLELTQSRVIEIMKDALTTEAEHFSSENTDRPPYCEVITLDNIQFVPVALKNNRILFEMSNSKVRFWHQTLQEYFAAVSLIDELLEHKVRNLSSRMNMSRLDKFLADESWHEIIALAYGLMVSSERLKIPNQTEILGKLIDSIWPRNRILASLCLSQTNDEQRQIPYVEKLRKTIFLWGISVPRAIPWMLSAFLITLIWLFPEPQTSGSYPLVLTAFVSILFGLIASLIFFRIYVIVLKYYEVFSYQKFVHPSIIALRYLQSRTAETVLFEFNERTLYDFSISDYAKTSMHVSRMLLKRSEEELINMLQDKTGRLHAVEILGEIGGKEAARALIGVLEKEIGQLEVGTLQSIIRSLMHILKRSHLAAERAILIDILKSFALDERQEFAPQLVAQRGLMSMGIADVKLPSAGSLARVYLIRLVISALAIALITLLILLRR